MPRSSAKRTALTPQKYDRSAEVAAPAANWNSPAPAMVTANAAATTVCRSNVDTAAPAGLDWTCIREAATTGMTAITRTNNGVQATPSAASTVNSPVRTRVPPAHVIAILAGTATSASDGMRRSGRPKTRGAASIATMKMMEVMGAAIRDRSRCRRRFRPSGPCRGYRRRRCRMSERIVLLPRRPPTFGSRFWG